MERLRGCNRGSTYGAYKISNLLFIYKQVAPLEQKKFGYSNYFGSVALFFSVVLSGLNSFGKFEILKREAPTELIKFFIFLIYKQVAPPEQKKLSIQMVGSLCGSHILCVPLWPEKSTHTVL